MICYRNSRRNIRNTTTTYYQYNNYRLQQLLLLVLVQVVLLSFPHHVVNVVIVVNGMAPPYPELIEESNKHRLLYKQLYDNVPLTLTLGLLSYSCLCNNRCLLLSSINSGYGGAIPFTTVTTTT